MNNNRMGAAFCYLVDEGVVRFHIDSGAIHVQKNDVDQLRQNLSPEFIESFLLEPDRYHQILKQIFQHVQQERTGFRLPASHVALLTEDATVRGRACAQVFRVPYDGPNRFTHLYEIQCGWESAKIEIESWLDGESDAIIAEARGLYHRIAIEAWNKEINQ